MVLKITPSQPVKDLRCAIRQDQLVALGGCDFIGSKTYHEWNTTLSASPWVWLALHFTGKLVYCISIGAVRGRGQAA
jgi:hypothetical protein